jgi:superfamily II DNA/RNA helicase
MSHLLDAINQIEGLTLIFVETKRSADRLEEELYNAAFSRR